MLGEHLSNIYVHKTNYLRYVLLSGDDELESARNYWLEPLSSRNRTLSPIKYK